MKIKELLYEIDGAPACWQTASCDSGGEVVDENEDEKHQLGWNVAEDLHIHMKNDPMFYRKQYYPCMAKLQDQLKQGNPIDVKKEMMPMISKAKDHYCAKYNRKVLIASTSEVYGDPLLHPQKEEYWGNVNCIGIRGVYDEAKRFAESMTMAYNRLHGIDVRIVRIFNTYGERMRRNDGRAIPNFITQSLADADVTVYGDGSQTRSIQHVSDLVTGIHKLMLSDVTTPVNIGNPAEMTMLQLAEKIIALTDSNSRIVTRPLPEDDPKIRLPDITKARTLLGWEPDISPDEGLQRTIKWFKQSRS